MPACIAGMVQQQEQLRCNSGSKGFKIADVVDAGGFATLLTGQLLSTSPPTSQVGARTRSCLRQHKPSPAQLPAGQDKLRLPALLLGVAAVRTGCSSQDCGGHVYRRRGQADNPAACQLPGWHEA
jgi:hypothetical protein